MIPTRTHSFHALIVKLSTKPDSAGQSTFLKFCTQLQFSIVNHVVQCVFSTSPISPLLHRLSFNDKNVCTYPRLLCQLLSLFTISWKMGERFQKKRKRTRSSLIPLYSTVSSIVSTAVSKLLLLFLRFLLPLLED